MTRVKVNEKVGSSQGYSYNPKKKQSGRLSFRSYNRSRYQWACKGPCAKKLNNTYSKIIFWGIVIGVIADYYFQDGLITESAIMVMRQLFDAVAGLIP